MRPTPDCTPKHGPGRVKEETIMSQKTPRKTPPATAQVNPTAAPNSRRGLLLASGSAITLGLAGGVYLWMRQGGAPAAQRAGLGSEHAPAVGDAAAKVHIVEFLDPACETCAVFYPMVKQMLAENRGRIRLSLRHIPLHQGADTVVAMLEASRKQDKYWPALEALLGTQQLWVQHHVVLPDMARQVVASVGLDMVRLAADMNAPDVAQRMAQDRSDAQKLGVKQTPEYFVNGKQMPSFGRQQLQDLVRQALNAAY
jgi:protein-disulfide isomerase